MSCHVSWSDGSSPVNLLESNARSHLLCWLQSIGHEGRARCPVELSKPSGYRQLNANLVKKHVVCAQWRPLDGPSQIKRARESESEEGGGSERGRKDRL